jgi:membrane protein DedA with SNARE-associated domain
VTALARELAGVPPWALVLVVFVVPALEASSLPGLLLPGEVAVLLGGVIAHEGRVPLTIVMAAAVLGACVGDSVGYALGARFGPRLFAHTPYRSRQHLARAEALLRRFGGWAVLGLVGMLTVLLLILAAVVTNRWLSRRAVTR